MSYKYDVFVSYRREPETLRWIKQHFVPLLELRLGFELQRKPVFYIDEQIEAGSSWPADLGAALGSSRVLVALWTANYFNSVWCTEEFSQMLARESEAKLRTAANPRGVIIPAFIHDGESFPPDLAHIKPFQIEFNPRMSPIGPLAYDRSMSEWALECTDRLKQELALLRSEPPKAFIDVQEISAGDSWAVANSDALIRSRVLVAFISPRYLAGFTASEFEIFRERSRTLKQPVIVPIVLRGDEVPEYVRELEFVDLRHVSWAQDSARRSSNEMELHIRRLARRISDLLDHAPEFDPSWHSLAAATLHHWGAAAHQRRDLDAAQRLYLSAVDASERDGTVQSSPAAYLELSSVARERGDIEAAERWALAALEMSTERDAAQGVELSTRALGSLAFERHDLESAAAYFTRSLEASERLQNEPGYAESSQLLGTVALARRDLGAAEYWLLRSLSISETLPAHAGLAHTSYLLGVVEQERREYEAAKLWFRRALALSLEGQNPRLTAWAYRQLGTIAYEQRDLEAAERLLSRSLEINQGEDRMVLLYQLGEIAQERGDHDNAERLYAESLAIAVIENNKFLAATIHLQIGRLALLQGRFDAAEHHFLTSLTAFESIGDKERADICRKSLAELSQLRGVGG